jgi:N,N'-diacetyllegionaminate synthase
MRIGSFDTDERVLVIAEIGNNHEGNVDNARRLVEEAAAAGADAVKFQTFRTERFASRADEARYARLESFELQPDDFAGLADLAHAEGLLFISTALDLGSVEVLEPLVDAFKVASGDNDFFPLLERLADTAKPVIVSSGLVDVAGIRRAVDCIRERWREQRIESELAVLQCVSSYPAPPEETNLRTIAELATELRCTVGYSDHTLGIDAAAFAVPAGARIVEKHFTLDKEFSDFRDHRLSADPAEMRELTRRVRTADELLGDGKKSVQPSEAETLQAIRRSIVAARDLRRGDRVQADDLMWIRPGDALRPGEEHRLVGRALTRDVGFGEQLLPSDVEEPGS